MTSLSSLIFIYSLSLYLFFLVLFVLGDIIYNSVIFFNSTLTGWCEEQSKESIQAVLDLNTPINVGLIGIGLDDSELLSEYLASIAENPLVEMVSHSYNHKSFRDKPLEWQEEDLADLNEMSNKVAKVPAFLTH